MVWGTCQNLQPSLAHRLGFVECALWGSAFIPGALCKQAPVVHYRVFVLLLGCCLGAVYVLVELHVSVGQCMRSETWSAGARAWRGHTAGYTAGHDTLFVGCVKGSLGVCCNARLSAPVFEASREYTFAGGQGGCFLAAWEARCTLLRCHFHLWGSQMVVDLPLLGISEGLSKLGVPK